MERVDVIAIKVYEVFVEPVPFKRIAWLPDGALSERVMLPLRLPAAVGLNSIPRTQLAPAVNVWPEASHVVSAPPRE